MILPAKMFCRRSGQVFKLIFICLTVVLICKYFSDKSYLFNHVIAYVFRRLHIPCSHIIHRNEARNVVPYENTFNYVINNPNICSQKQPFLVVFVKTHPSNVDQRHAIRHTWGDVSSYHFTSNFRVVVLFSLGTAGVLFPDLQKRVEEENALYGDLIQENYVDDFYNLTRKVIGQLKWTLTYCSNAKYFMTTDDDIFVRIPNLITFLTTLEGRNLYLGYVHKGSSPDRRVVSKYYVSQDIYSGRYYPDYCPGAGYVLSMDVINMIFKHVSSVPMLYIDDVFIGILVDKVGVTPQHSSRFSGEAKALQNSCSYNYFITSHGYKPNELIELNKDISKYTNNKYTCMLLKLWYY